MNLFRSFAAGLLLLTTACQTSRSPRSAKLDTPEKFLRRFLDLARQGDYDALKTLIYPTPLSPEMTMREAVIQVMKENRPLTYTGDFSYSDRALENILNSHLHRFTSNAPLFWLKTSDEGGVLDEHLARKTGRDPTRFRLFSHSGCNILLVDLEGELSLLFWEGMNHLLEKR